MREERKPAPRRLGDVLAEVVRRSIRPRRRALGELELAWVRAVGPEVARRSRPVGFRAGRLTVAFDSSALRQEVACFRSEEILRRLREAAPGTEISSLRCVLR